MKIRVYLDNCCLNRPFDDMLTPLVRLEIEAKHHIQRQILEGNIELAWSFILDHENSDNPYEERRNAIAPWKHQAVVHIGVSGEVIRKANAIAKLGLKSKDALHLSCALQARCRYFLTTDRRILKKRVEGLEIVNPVEYIQKTEG